MDGDRKYSQRGYMDNDRNPKGGNGNHDRPKPQGPRPPIDVTGPRLPRLVQNVTAARCFNCSTMLAPGTDFTGACPKCGVQLHCCKQCSFFEPSTRFQCVKPIPVRIPVKDQKNDCPLFSPRVTVARDVSGPAVSNGNGGGKTAAEQILAAPPRNANDAKSAFERLFKK
jgi:hypothetical protein